MESYDSWPLMKKYQDLNVSSNLTKIQNKGIRFEDVDLNRVWRNKDIENLRNESSANLLETREQKDIFLIIQELLKEPGPFYFLDMHTTSASSVPFITISDSLNNRRFSANFPIPVVLGIEEYLDGPLLTFINEYGHIALGFEGGAHHDESSIVNCEAFIWKALVRSKCVDASNVPNFKYYQNVFRDLCCEYKFFEIKYRYQVSEKEKRIQEMAEADRHRYSGIRQKYHRHKFYNRLCAIQRMSFKLPFSSMQL